MENILEVFYKWLDFRKVEIKNKEYEEHPKLKYKFKDDDIHKEWVGFYSVYLKAFNSGRMFEAQNLAIYSTQRITEIK